MQDIYIKKKSIPSLAVRYDNPVLMTYRPARLHKNRLAESISWNRCLGSLNVYKYVLSTKIGTI